MAVSQLGRLVEAIFQVSDGTYGYRRVHAQLVRQGESCCPELVRELMRERDLVPCQPKPWRPTTTLPGHAGPVPDLVNRDLHRCAAGHQARRRHHLCPDLAGFVYLAVYLASVIDCVTKECVGYALADHMRAELVVEALDMAARNERLAAGAIFHSDRGSQYLSEQICRALRAARDPSVGWSYRRLFR